MSPHARLNASTLSQISPDIRTPQYRNKAVATGIVHLGIGNFHRAHQAVYTDTVLTQGDLRWGIKGVSLRSSAVKQLMEPQDGLYSVTFQDTDTEETRIIGSVSEVLYAPDNPFAVLDAMCAETVKIVSLTITEKGYMWPEGLDPVWDPARFQDYSASALLYIVEALYRRRAQGLPPFTLLSCDNLAENGKTLRSAVLRLAKMKDEAFASALEAELRAPCSMVDRIVPQTTQEDIASAGTKLGVEDAAAIATEKFGQWVIEDDFPLGRPDWAQNDGVRFVEDVTPYEEMKLRLLNGAHSYIALYGQLNGLAYVNDVMADPAARRFLASFWQNAGQTMAPEIDVKAYTNRLIARFENTKLRHQTAQIVMDTSQKLPQRILDPIFDLLNQDGAIAPHISVVAMWYEFILRTEDLKDPLADELRVLAKKTDIRGFVQDCSIFPNWFKTRQDILDQLDEAHQNLALGSAL